MASGSFSNGSGQNCKLVINWNSSPGNGGSTVSASLIAQNQNNAYFSAVVYGYGITINGSSNSGSGAGLSSSMNGQSTLISHSTWVGYYGNKTININGYANFNGIWSLSNQSISGDVALDKVGEKPTMGSALAPKTGIYDELTSEIVVQWEEAKSYNNKGDYTVDVSINNGGWTNVSGNLDWGTTDWTYTVSDSSPGDTYAFRIACCNEVGQSSHAYTGIITLNKLEPPSIGDIDTYNPYLTSTLKINLSDGSQLLGTEFARLCALYYEDTLLLNSSDYSATEAYNTSQSLAYAANNYLSCLGTTIYKSDKFKIVAWCENANGTKSSTVSKNFVVDINTDGGATPLLNTPVLSGGEFGYDSTCFVQDKSIIKVKSPNATLRRSLSGAKLTYSISVTDCPSVNAQEQSYSYLRAGKKTAKVSVVDERGLEASASINFMVQDYTKPSIKELKASRLDDPQTSVVLTYQLFYTPIYQYPNVDTQGAQLNDINTMQYAAYLKDYDTSGGFTWYNLDSRTTTTITDLSTEKVFWARLKITDKLYPSVNESATYTEATVLIPTIYTNLGIRSWGIGINCVPQTKWGLEVSGNSYFKNQVEIDDDLQVDGNEDVKGSLTVPQIDYTGTGGSLKWNLGRDNAFVRIKDSYNEFTPVMSLKTKNGSWEIGGANIVGSTDKLLINYVLDTYYDGTTGMSMYTRQYNLSTPDTKNTDDTLLTLGMAFPIGAVYITYNNVNPSTFLGGTWVQFSQGRTLVGVGESDDEDSNSRTFEEAEEGGKYKRYLVAAIGATHNTINRIGYIASSISQYQANNGITYAIDGSIGAANSSARHWDHGTPVAEQNADIAAGETPYVDMMTPYITVYFWRRTA